jgi:hypothetical protein
VEDKSTDEASAALVQALTQMARAFQSVTAHIGVLSYLIRALLLDRLRDAPDPARALEDFRQTSIKLILEQFMAEDSRNDAVRNEAMEITQALLDRIAESLGSDATRDFDFPPPANGTGH